MTDMVANISKTLLGGKNGSLMSRKWVALVLCAALFYVGKLSNGEFTYIIMAYLGSQGLADAFGKKS